VPKHHAVNICGGMGA